jgi:hypothetical protein
MARFRDPAVAGFAAGMSGGGDFVMGDWGGAPGMEPGMQHLLLAEILGLAMARRAADILDRHRAALMGAPSGAAAEADSGADGGAGLGADGSAGGMGQPDEADDAQFALDNAIFTAVLDAANECLGQFDARPSDERWCDALLQLIQLAQVARDPAGPGGPS